MAKRGRPRKLKTGRFTIEEQKFIRENMGTMSAESIALALNRRVENIRKFIQKESTVTKQPAEVVRETKQSRAWDRLASEFTDEEIKYIGQEYAKLIEQFHENITPSEENQLMDVVKLMVMISRSIAQKKHLLDRANELEEKIETLRRKHKDIANNQAALTQYNELLRSLEACEKNADSKVDEFVKLQKQKESILQSLKATRSQRIEKLQDSGKFLQLMEQFRSLKNQEAESRHVELVRRAKERTRKELEEPHKFVTGEVDVCLLTPDLIERGMKEVPEN